MKQTMLEDYWTQYRFNAVGAEHSWVKSKMNVATVNRCYNEMSRELHRDSEFHTNENVSRFNLVLQDTWSKSGKTTRQDLPLVGKVALQ